MVFSPQDVILQDLFRVGALLLKSSGKREPFSRPRKKVDHKSVPPPLLSHPLITRQLCPVSRFHLELLFDGLRQLAKDQMGVRQIAHSVELFLKLNTLQPHSFFRFFSVLYDLHRQSSRHLWAFPLLCRLVVDLDVDVLW